MASTLAWNRRSLCAHHMSQTPSQERGVRVGRTGGVGRIGRAFTLLGHPYQWGRWPEIHDLMTSQKTVSDGKSH